MLNLNKPSQDEFDDLLQHFDNIAKNTKPSRRASVNYLWDAYMELLFVVGVKLCGFYAESLDSVHLARRWRQIKQSLSIVEDPKNWNYLITKLDGIRQRVQHNSNFDPNLDELNVVREKAPDFKKWIINTGKKFYKVSKKLDLVDDIKRKMSYYTSEAEIMLAHFGTEKIPYVARYAYEPYIKEDIYSSIPKLKKILEKREFKIRDISDVNQSDFETLVGLIEITSKLNAWEDALLKDNICPKCGGKISQTQDDSGGSYDEPPTSVHYRIGCDSCDYELMTESYSI